MCLTAAGVKEPEVTTIWRAAMDTLEVNSDVPVQVASLGPNRLKVTVPVGVTPPLTVAVSKIEVPTTPPAEGLVAMVGVAWVMVTGSAAQPELAVLLLASPP